MFARIRASGDAANQPGHVAPEAPTLIPRWGRLAALAHESATEICSSGRYASGAYR